MSMKLVHDFSGLTAVQALLHRAGEKLADPTPLLREIGAVVLQGSRECFDTMTGPDGKKWAPLSADTVINRVGGVGRVYTKRMRFRKNAARAITAIRILFMAGHLRNSLTFYASRTGVEIGTNMPYGGVHQNGGRAGRGRKVVIPARPYLGLSSATEGQIVGLTQSYLRAVLP